MRRSQTRTAFTEHLRQSLHASVDEMVAAVGCDWETARRLLARLCRRGMAMYDLQTRLYRHRELFPVPIDETQMETPDPRRQRGLEYVTRRQVEVATSGKREMRKQRQLSTPDGPIVREVVFHDWQTTGRVADQGEVEIVLNDEGRVIFGKCGCAFFRDHILNQGPCEHMIALLEASADRRDEGESVNDAGPAPDAW